MKDAYTIHELAEATGKSRTAMLRRATKENWPQGEPERPNRGRPKVTYLFTGLPEDVREAVLLHARTSEAPSCALPPAAHSTLPDETAAPAPKTAALTPRQRDKALAWAALIRLYRQAERRAKGRGAKLRAKHDFILAYNNGAYPEILEKIGPTSFKTLERQALRLKRAGGDPLALADTRGTARRGTREVGPEQARILIACAMNPSAPPISEIIRTALAVMRERGIEDGLSQATYRRFLEDYRRMHFDSWTFQREGEKALEDKVLLTLRRDPSLLAVGDVVVADGHTLNFEVLNPRTGKPKRMHLIGWYDFASNYPLGWEIAAEEDTQSIAAALRRAILRLGKIPQVAYLDNGKAFAGKYFNGCDFRQAGFVGLFDRLGIRTIFARPYNAKAKPIERFFGTFAEFERRALTFSGTSVETKPARLRRNERVHRALFEKLSAGRYPTIEETHRAIAAWVDEYAARPQTKGHLQGRCPQEVFDAGRGPGVDPEALRLLMLSSDVRMITRQGVTLNGRTYYSPALYGRRHEVVLRYDPQEPESVLVYDMDGRLLCEARELAPLHPAAEHLGTGEDVARLKEALALQQRLKRQTMGPARAFIEAEVVPQVRRQLERLGWTGGEAPTETRKPEAQAPLTEAERRRIAREVEELARATEEMRAKEREAASSEEDYVPEVVREPSVFERLAGMDDMDRYEELVALQAKGVMIPKDELAWMRFFEASAVYARHREYFEEYRVKAALAFGR